MKTFSPVSFAFASALVTLAACSHDSGPAPAAEPTTVTAAVTKASTTSDLAVGSVAPDFNATASNGTAIQLSALKGKPVVVYFYPKDETPGCTTEACSFRDAWNGLSAKGVVLIGISADSDASHKDFAKNHQLPFLLVSDPNGSIAQKFGVPNTGGYLARQSFVIGPDGNVKKIYRTVDVSNHAAQIAADVP